MVAYSAVGYEKKGAEKPMLGSVKIESDTSVSLDERLVHFTEFKLTEVNFDKLDRERGQGSHDRDRQRHSRTASA